MCTHSLDSARTVLWKKKRGHRIDGITEHRSEHKEKNLMSLHSRIQWAEKRKSAKKLFRVFQLQEKNGSRGVWQHKLQAEEKTDTFSHSKSAYLDRKRNMAAAAGGVWAWVLVKDRCKDEIGESETTKSPSCRVYSRYRFVLQSSRTCD